MILARLTLISSSNDCLIINLLSRVWSSVYTGYPSHFSLDVRNAAPETTAHGRDDSITFKACPSVPLVAPHASLMSLTQAQ